jgi:hypothetical protein
MRGEMCQLDPKRMGMRGGYNAENCQSTTGGKCDQGELGGARIRMQHWPASPISASDFGVRLAGRCAPVATCIFPQVSEKRGSTNSETLNLSLDVLQKADSMVDRQEEKSSNEDRSGSHGHK